MLSLEAKANPSPAEPQSGARRWGWFRIALASWVLFSLVLGALYLRVPPSPDDAVFDYGGWVLIHGGATYVDVADTNWPAMFWVHSLSAWIFGNTLWGFHVIDYLFLLATCGLMGLWVYRYFGGLAALLVIPVYQIMYVTQSNYFAGERDMWSAPFLILAAYALTRRIEGGVPKWSVLQGASLAFAVLFKPTFVFFGPLLALADILVRKQSRRSFLLMARDHVIAAGTSGFILLGVAAWGWHTGGLREWYHATFKFIFEVYRGGSSEYWSITGVTLHFIVTAWHWILVLAAFGWACYWRPHRLPALLLPFIILSAILSHVIQRKGFGYHLAPVYPVFALAMAPLVGAAFSRAFKRADPGSPSRPLPRLLACGVCLLVVLGLAKKMTGTFHDHVGWYLGKVTTQELLRPYAAGEDISMEWAAPIADHIRQEVPPEGYMLCWGQAMIFNFMAERRSPTRFAAFQFLNEPRPAFSLFGAWRDEVERAFREKTPKLILLIRAQEPGTYRHLPEHPQEPRLSDVVRSELKARYEFDRSIGPVDFYRLRAR